VKTEWLLRDEKGTDTLRKSGIEVVGNIPLGTHLCQFYETKEDLIEILVPYFAEGLRNNEFCMWVTSPPLGLEEAKAALQKAVPDLEQYIKKGQIEILPHTDWYLLGGEFDADRVLRGWVQKEKRALDRGFDGLRLTGNTFWIERNHWKRFVDYEATVNDVIGAHRIIAICTYSLEKCTGSDVVDVMRNHQSVLFKKGETWVLAEDVYKRRLWEVKAIENEAKLGLVFAASPDAITVTDLNGNIIECNQAKLDMEGYSSKEELIGKSAFEVIAKKDHKRAMENLKKTLEQGLVKNIEYTLLTKDGREFPAELSASVIKDSLGNPIGFVAITKDITERKIMEKRIAYLASIVDNARVAISTVDMNGIVTYCNKATEEMLGWASTEAIGKLMATFCPNAGKQIEATVKEGFCVDKELEYVKKDGGTLPCSTSTFLMKDKDGKPIGVCGIAIDITERKMAEDALRKSENKSRTLLENLPQKIFFKDRNSVYISCNENYARDLRIKPHEITGKTDYDFYPKKLAEKYRADDKRIMESGKTEDIEEEYIQDGRKVFVHTVKTPVKDETGNVVGVLGIFWDVTERKKAEEKLIESEERFRNLYGSIRDPVGVFVGREGRLVDYNKAFNRLSGYTDEELKDKTFLDFVHPDDQALVLERYGIKYPEEELPLVYEIRAVNKKGEIIPVEISVSIYKVKGKVIGIEVIHRDITRRKRAEEELIRLSSAVKMSTDSIVIGDLNAKIIDVNEATLKMYGTDDKRDLIGKNSFDLIAPEDREEALMGLKEALEKGYVKGREYNIITKDGTRIPVEMNAAIMKDADGKPIGFVGISRDITERKKAEEKIIESEEQFRNLFESASDGILTFDLRGRITSVNKKIEEISGFSREEIIGKHFTHFARMGIISLKDISWFLKAFSRRIKGEPTKVYEIKIRNKKGQEKFVEFRGSLIKQRGKPIEVLEIIRDVTERKEMEEKLRQYSERLEELVQKRTEELLESEKRYSVLVEEASDGVAIIQEGKIVFTNKRASEISGHSKDELIGLPFEKVVDEKYRQLVKERYQKRLRGEMIPTTYEIELIAKTSERIPIELSGARTHYQGRPADLIIVRDIRERKRMEEQRLRLEKLATMGELATMVGHDLRNPLQSIENATYYLINELPFLSPSLPNPKKTMKMLQAINSSVNYADKIIRDLQDFSATKTPVLEKTDINTLVKETLSQVEAPRNVELRTELGQLPEIKVDKDQIKRVFLNLALNGIQAMENGGTLTVSTKKTNSAVEISFKDTGVGMSKENMEKIFTPFFTTKAKGIGMGLPICKKFVESHGGSIAVESEVGKGTTFTVKLPIQQENGGENQ